MAAAAAAGDDAAQTTRCARLRSAVAAALGSGGLLPRSGPSPGPAVLPRTPCRAGGCGYSAAARCFSHARARGGGRSVQCINGAVVSALQPALDHASVGQRAALNSAIGRIHGLVVDIGDSGFVGDIGAEDSVVDDEIDADTGGDAHGVGGGDPRGVGDGAGDDDGGSDEDGDSDSDGDGDGDGDGGVVVGMGDAGTSTDTDSSDGDDESDDSFDDMAVAPAASLGTAPRTSQDLSQHLPMLLGAGMRHPRPLRPPRKVQPNALAALSRALHIRYVCNCTHGVRGLGCCVDAGGDLCEYAQEQYALARQQAGDVREPNNLQRKRCYRHCAHVLGYKWRRKLPHCVVAVVRSAWPEACGHYMGFYSA
jgi:hypothetical protein